MLSAKRKRRMSTRSSREDVLSIGLPMTRAQRLGRAASRHATQELPARARAGRRAGYGSGRDGPDPGFPRKPISSERADAEFSPACRKPRQLRTRPFLGVPGLPPAYDLPVSRNARSGHASPGRLARPVRSSGHASSGSASGPAALESCSRQCPPGRADDKCRSCRPRSEARMR